MKKVLFAASKNLIYWIIRGFALTDCPYWDRYIAL